MIQIIDPDFNDCFNVFSADGAFVRLKSQCLRTVAAHTLEYKEKSIEMIEARFDKEII